MSETVTWVEWAKQVNSKLEELRRLSHSNQEAFGRIVRIEDALTKLYEEIERPRLVEELADWKSERQIRVGWKPNMSGVEWFTYFARATLLNQFRKEKLVEERHQGPGRPILYRWKGSE